MSDPFLHIHTNMCIISVTLNVSSPSGYFLEDQEQTSCSETSMCVHVCEEKAADLHFEHFVRVGCDTGMAVQLSTLC